MTVTVAAPQVVTRSRRLKRRHLWLVPGLAIAIFANAQAAPLSLSLVYLLTFGIVPHLPALLPNGRRLFNVLHHPLAPAALAGVALAGLLPLPVLVSALAWLSHIVVDWALGDGIRHADGTRRGLLA